MFKTGERLDRERVAAALVGGQHALRSESCLAGAIGDQAASHGRVTSHSNGHMFGEAAGPDRASGLCVAPTGASGPWTKS